MGYLKKAMRCVGKFPRACLIDSLFLQLETTANRLFFDDNTYVSGVSGCIGFSWHISVNNNERRVYA